MSSRLNVEQSMRLIDRHLLPSAGERAARSSIVSGYPRAEDDHARHGRELPPAKTLPAFYTCARDGPSPYDAHKGSYQCSVDDVWNDQTQFELGFVSPDSGTVRWHGNEPGASRKSTEALTHLTRGGPGDCLVTVDSLRMPSIVLVKEDRKPAADRGATPTVPVRENGDAQPSQARQATTSSAAAAALYEEVLVTNPQRDRMALEAEVGDTRAARFASTLHSNQRKLCTKCVRAHPHGALGIRESPYGPETGAVYAEHRQQLLRDAQKEGRAMRRMDVPKPVDSVFGSCVYRGEEAVHGPRTGNAPRDHLLGGFVYHQERPLPEPYGNASSMFQSV